MKTEKFSCFLIKFWKEMNNLEEFKNCEFDQIKTNI